MSDRPRLTALDGIRAIAVLLVLLFHFRIGPFRGGFVGVTIFFTLSGFLICARTLSEVDRRQRFAVARFIERRVRRLAPASFACIFGVVIATGLIGAVTQKLTIKGDAFAAMLNVANWRFLAQGNNYADLFAAPSPLNHYWSLAIEEQFYLLFPLAVVGVLWLRRRYRAPAVTVLLAGLAAWALFVSFTTSSYSRFYYGTDTRMLELLVGVGLALSWYFWVIPVSPRSVWLRGALNVGGFAAIAAIVVTACVFRNGGVSYQHGGALVVAAASAVLIFACLDSRRPVARLLSIAPLAWIGKVSYGAYLYHWPIYALSGNHWGPLRGIWLSLAQLALSLALAGLSFRYLEAPILRRRRVQGTKRLAVSWGSAAAMVAVAALVVPSLQPAQTSTGLASANIAVSSRVRVEPKVTLPRTVELDRPLRIVIVGDSTAEAMAIALVNYQNAHPQQIQVLNLSQSGCPFTSSRAIRYYSGDPGRDVQECSNTWRTSVPNQVRAFQPDVSLVVLSLVEQADQLDATGAAWHNVLEPAWQTQQEHAFEDLVTDLEVTGAPVAWTDAPYCKFQQDLPWFGDEPARTDALNVIYRDLAGKEPKFTLLPYAAQLNRPDHFVDTSLRPDGVHLGVAPARALLQRWVLPELDRYRPRTVVAPSTTPPTPPR